jgi:hypothetical protein
VGPPPAFTAAFRGWGESVVGALHRRAAWCRRGAAG